MKDGSFHVNTVIYRFELAVGETLEVKDVKRILRVEAKSDTVVEFWAIIEPGYSHSDHPTEFEIVGTGMKLPVGYFWEGTSTRTPAGLVWHVISTRV